MAEEILIKQRFIDFAERQPTVYAVISYTFP